MLIITDLQELACASLNKPCVLALGTFDGLHRGHVDVIKGAKDLAQERNCLLGVFTFSNHPLEVIRPEAVPAALVREEEKLALLEGLGVELLINLPFTRAMLQLEPEAFLEQLYSLGLGGIVVGENFTYGAQGRGNIASLKAAFTKWQLPLVVRPLVKAGEQIISSTLIRGLITAGQVKEAAALLGRPYSIAGRVVQGQQRGRLLGFPTANIELAGAKYAIPAVGVYAVKAAVKGSYYLGMANIGNNPTFGDVPEPRLEVHLLDFAGDIYGQNIIVEFVAHLRQQQAFSGLEQLKQQLAKDLQATRAAVKL